jgi:hypothetical protein
MRPFHGGHQRSRCQCNRHLMRYSVQRDTMLTLIANLTIQTGKEPEFAAKMHTVMPKVREEPRNHTYIMYRLQDKPRVLIFKIIRRKRPWTPNANICASWGLICVPCLRARPCRNFTKGSRKAPEDRARTAVACHTLDCHGAGNTRALGQYGARTVPSGGRGPWNTDAWDAPST